MVHMEANELKIMGCGGQSSHFGATGLEHHVTLTTPREMYNLLDSIQINSFSCKHFYLCLNQIKKIS
jgi:hypothetical protein